MKTFGKVELIIIINNNKNNNNGNDNGNSDNINIIFNCLLIFTCLLPRRPQCELGKILSFILQGTAKKKYHIGIEINACSFYPNSHRATLYVVLHESTAAAFNFTWFNGQY